MEIPLKKKTTISMPSSSFLQVPDDVVVDHILWRLDVATRARFSAVCRSWRDLSRQAALPMPCLIITGFYPRNLLNTYSHYLLDPVFPTADHLLLLRRRVDVHYNIAGCHGPYLIYTPAASHSIVYNPFSGETLQLPRTGLHPDGSAEPVGYLERAQLSSTPASCTSPGRTTLCLVAAVASNFRSSVCICRLGVHGAMDDDDDREERYWVASRVLGKGMSIKDLIFHKGILYCICENRTGHRIMAIDLHHLLRDDHHHDDLIMPISLPAPRLVTVLGNKNHPRDGSLQHYLVVGESSSGGELLVATQHQLSDPSTTSESRDPKLVVFRLHKVVGETNRPTTSRDPKTSSTGRAALLVEVDDLGDTMLFLGRGCSRPWRWSELRNNNNNNVMGETPTFVKKGCIYFVDVQLRKPRLGRFCVGKGTDGGETGARVAEFLSLYGLQPSSSSFCRPWISLPNL